MTLTTEISVLWTASRVSASRFDETVPINEILANSSDLDQTLQNAASDQGLHSLLILQEVKSEMKQSVSPCSEPFFPAYA